MKILITTGIFPPDTGGSATYAAKLAEGLAENGHEVSVLTMADPEKPDQDRGSAFAITRVGRGSKLSNYWRYFWALISRVWQADVVYTLNYFSYGFLTALACRLAGTPYVVRVGGCNLWEHFYLYEHEPIPLAEFYDQKLYKQYPLQFRILRFVLTNAERVVFNSGRQADLYRKPFGLASGRTTVVQNPVPENEFAHQRTNPNKEIVYAGRLTPMKNVSALVQAFAQANLPEYTLIIIGDGPTKDKLQSLARECGIADRTEFASSMPQDKLFERIINARLVVLPSWTDISPNLVFECQSLGIPVLVTEENYLPFRDQLLQMIDPSSAAGIVNTLSLLARDNRAYSEYVKAFTAIEFTQSWDDIITEHEDLFTQLTN